MSLMRAPSWRHSSCRVLGVDGHVLVAEIGEEDLGLVAVARQLDDVLDLVSPLAAERGIRLERIPGKRLERAALADPMRLKQVLLNLVTNAIKFTPSGGHVDIGVYREGRNAVLQIEDTGPGTCSAHGDGEHGGGDNQGNNDGNHH